MQKLFHNVLVSLLPVLLVLPAMADERIVINDDATYTDLSLSGISTAANGGAMSVNNESVVTFDGETNFTNNSSTAGGYGGAIFINNNGSGNSVLNELVFNGVANFIGNSVVGGGGAIYSEGKIVFNDTASFADNTTTGGSGAAIGANAASDITFKKSATFNGNGVGTTTTGGAISNSGRMVFEDTATFVGNNSTVNGAAIDNGGLMVFQQGIELTNNTGGSNSGAVSNGGDFFVYGGDINVSGNTAHKGSGLFLGDGSRTLLGAYMDEGDNLVVAPVDNIVFNNNVATGVNAAALAVQNGVDTVQMYATNITFDGNTSATKYGGAIFNASQLQILGANNTFSNNTLNETAGGKTGGGAIHNRGVFQNGKIADLTIGTADSINLFENNTSKSFGGAIAARAVDGENQDSSVKIYGQTIFDGNVANMDGGAIWNYVAESAGTTGNAILNFNGDTTFQNNLAGGLGGAIYNNDVVNVNGGALFDGNKSGVEFDGSGDVIAGSGVANDIYNAGTVNLNASSGNSIVFNDGIDGLNGTLNINSENGYTGNVVFNASVTNNQVLVAGGTLTNNAIIDGDVTVNGGNVDNADLNNSQIIGSVSIADGATLSTFANTIATDAGSTIGNSGILTLVGGTLSKDVTGTGSVFVDGTVVNGAEIENSVRVNSGKSLETSANTIATGANATITNAGTLTLTDGALSKNVTGNGWLVVDGALTNVANIANKVRINQNKSLETSASLLDGAVTNNGTLTLTGGTLAQNVTGNGSLIVNNSVSSDAGYLGNDVTNNGTLTLTGGALSSDVLGGGSLIVNGAVTNTGTIENAVTINQNKSLSTAAGLLANGVTNNGTLTLTSGTLTQNVGGSGSLVVDGTVTNNANIANVVTIKQNKSLSTAAGLLGKNVTNNGTLTLTGGTLSRNISGNGSLVVNGAVTNTGTIGNTVTIKQNKSLSTAAGLLGKNVTNNGTLTLTDGALSQNVGGSGSLIVNGAVTNTGTIANAITINSSGDFTSSADKLTNTIANNGTLTLNGGTLARDITGNGTLNVAEGNSLYVGTKSIQQNKINLNGTMVAELVDVNDAPRFTTGDFAGYGTLQLVMREAGTYKVFGDDSFDLRLIEFLPEGITVDSPLYNLAWDDNGNVSATQKSADEVAYKNKISDDAALMTLNLVNSSSEKLNDLGVENQARLAARDTNAVERAARAINPETGAVIHTIGVSNQNMISNLVAGRTTAPIAKNNYGELRRNAMWIQGIYNDSKYDDVFDGKTIGIVAGFDGTVDKIVTVGAGYSFAHSDVNGTERDTDIDTLTVFLYGQYKPKAWYIDAFANYSMFDYTEKGDVFGTSVSSDYDVKSFGGQIVAGYNFDGGITPEIGLRYMHLSVNDFKNNLDIKTKIDDTNYLTAMIGTKYTHDIEMSKKLLLRPEFRYGLKYDALSERQIATISLPGVDTYKTKADRLSRVGNEFGLGFGVIYQGLDLSVGYELELRHDFTSHTGRARIRYEF